MYTVEEVLERVSKLRKDFEVSQSFMTLSELDRFEEILDEIILIIEEKETQKSLT